MHRQETSLHSVYNLWYRETTCGKGGLSAATLLGPAGPPTVGDHLRCDSHLLHAKVI